MKTKDNCFVPLKPHGNTIGLFLLGIVWGLLFPTNALTQTGAPCNAVRWDQGGHWTGTGNNNCGVNDAPNAPQPKGVVRCANAADTQSGINPNTTYTPANFTITPSSCIDPKTNPPVGVTVDPRFQDKRYLGSILMFDPLQASMIFRP